MSLLLVTGAQGFLGRAFVAAALASGDSVIGYGRSERADDRYTHRISVGGGSVPALAPPEYVRPLSSHAYEYHRGDLLDTDDLAALLRSKRPRAIVHLAAALRDDDFDTLMRTNVKGTMALFDAVAAAGIDVEKIVIGSSASVYGKPESVPIPEAARCEPEDFYGVSKLASERVAAIRSKKLGTLVCSARIFNVVGAGQDERHVCGKLASQAVAFAGGRARTLQFGDLRPTRDFVDVRDAAAAIALLVRAGTGTYNVCSQVET
ncbi:MAG TPA: NAD-dependent epimerase/dehydratase family protein, partial [Candidatus Baltobacteraceae bacterium]|nr:NAD-dependent epimerase/dehydratase family protein [Candidatus Baltobacteraceae bacterium]